MKASWTRTLISMASATPCTKVRFAVQNGKRKNTGTESSCRVISSHNLWTTNPVDFKRNNTRKNYGMITFIRNINYRKITSKFLEGPNQEREILQNTPTYLFSKRKQTKPGSSAGGGGTCPMVTNTRLFPQDPCLQKAIGLSMGSRKVWNE